MAKWFSSFLNPSKTAKLVRFEGGVERLKIKTKRKINAEVGMKVAEIMLENPNRFVCNVGSLEAGHRVSALPAEEEIEAGNTYVLFPMQKLRSVLSESEMRGIHQSMKKKKSKRNSSHANKIVPLSQNEGFEAEKSYCLPEMEETMEMRKCGRRCDWKPSLQTIQETRSLKFAENAQERPVVTSRLR